MLARVLALLTIVWVPVFGVVGVADGQIAGVPVSGTVRADTTSRALAATLTFVGPARTSVRTSANGKFATVLPPGTYTVSVTSEGFREESHELVVTPDQPLSIAIQLAAKEVLREIGRVSTSVTGAHFNVTPVTTTQVTSAQIVDQGAVGMGLVLSQIPGLQIGIPTLGSGRASLDDPGLPISVGLRGAQPYETATLYDGHRLTAGYSVWNNGALNLANFDPTSYRSLDVVRGPGAASPTINNAIGGYVNIVPLSPAGPPQADFSIDNDGYGGWTMHSKASGETTNHRVGVALVASSRTSPGLQYGGQRGYYDYNYWSTIDGVPYTIGQNQVSTNPSIQYGPFVNHQSALVSQIAPAGSSGYTNLQQRAVDLRYDATPTTTVNLRYALNNGAYNWAAGPFEQTIVFERPAGYTGPYPNGYTVSDGGMQNGFQATERDSLYEFDVRSRIGVGTVRYSYASYDQLGTYNNGTWGGQYTINGLVETYPNGSDSGAVPVIYNNQTVTLGDGQPATQWVSWLAKTHDALVEASYPVGASVFSLSYQQTHAAQGYSADAPSWLAGSTVPGEFSRFSTVRLRYDAPVTDRLSTQFALYSNGYEYHLTDPASTVSSSFIDKTSSYLAPRIAFSWRPTTNLAFRASSGAGVAPLDLSYLAGSNGAPQPNDLAAPTYYQVTLANPNLKPETSWSHSVGADWRLRDGATVVSTDVYTTTLHGQYFTSETANGTYLGKPLYITQAQNLGQSRYEGLEFSVNHDVPVGLTYTVSGALQRAYTYGIPSGFYDTAAGAYTTNLAVVPNVNFNGAFGVTSVPYMQGYASIGWRTRRHGRIALDTTYFGNNNALYRPAFFTFDLDAGVPMNKYAELTLTLRNLTNIYPQRMENYMESYALPFVHAASDGTTAGIGQPQNVGPRALGVGMRLHL